MANTGQSSGGTCFLDAALNGDRCGGKISPGTGVVETSWHFFAPQRENRDALILNDPQPSLLSPKSGAGRRDGDGGHFRPRAGDVPLFLPPDPAAGSHGCLIGTTFAPIISTRATMASPWVTSIVLVALMMAAAGLMLTMLAGDHRMDGQGAGDCANIKQQLYVSTAPWGVHELESALCPRHRPSRSSHQKIGMVTPVAAAITPAVAQSVLFFRHPDLLHGRAMKFRR